MRKSGPFRPQLETVTLLNPPCCSLLFGCQVVLLSNGSIVPGWHKVAQADLIALSQILAIAPVKLTLFYR